MSAYLKFLGTGTSTGVPAFYCDCPACKEAIEHPQHARGGPSVLIQSELESVQFNTLIDTAQELRQQLLDANVTSVDAIIYTHEHNDHVAGLGTLEYYVRLKRKQSIPVYAGASVITYLKSHFDFMEDCLEFNEIKAFEQFELAGITYLPLPATHNPGCFGFLISHSYSNEFKCAYFPDTSRLPKESEDAIRGADIIILDATFNGDNWMPKKHLSIDDAINYLVELECKQGYLTHLSMTYDTPITVGELAQKLEIHHGKIKTASDGLRINLLSC